MKNREYWGIEKSDGTYAHYAPILVLESESLSPYAICLPVIFPFSNVNVATKKWFMYVFQDCYEKKRTERSELIAQHSKTLLSAIEAQKGDAGYIEEVNQTFQGIAKSHSQKHLREVIKALRRIIEIAERAPSECSWIARENTEQIGPDYMPWPVMCLSVDELVKGNSGASGCIAPADSK